MRKFFIAIFLCTGYFLFAEWISVSGNSGDQLFDIRNSNSQDTAISFNLAGYEQQSVQEGNRIFQKISYQNEGRHLETGKPDLPCFSRFVAIPFEGTVSVEIVSFQKEIVPNIDVYPTQHVQSESRQENRDFAIDSDFYNGQQIYPANIVWISDPQIMRDLRLVNVTVNPFQYDPAQQELIIYRNIEFQLHYSGSGGINPKRNTRSTSLAFQSTYKSNVINYETSSAREDEFSQPNYLFIYPEDNQVATNLSLLTDWKKCKGFQVVSASTTDTGTSASSIKQYIQNAYDTWENPPEFICLVGDAGGNFSIPTEHLDGGEGDQYYVLLEGNDILADAFIGRISFNSIFELQTVIYKILHYEQVPYMGNLDWYNKALLVGDPTTSGQSCVDTKLNVKYMMQEYSSDFSFDEVYSAPWVSQMNSSFNAGVSYFNYRGYYGMSGWQNTEIDNLNNGLMLPVAVLLTCAVGNFEGTFDSRTERFLKAGSPGNPKGAVAAIGTATSDTNTCFNNCVDAGIYYGIFVDDIYHLGGALNRGKLNLSVSYPNNPYNAIYKFSYWNNLMGDPGMDIWTGVPQTMLVNYESELPLGSNYCDVSVTTDTGLPLEKAWVTILREDDIFATGWTDENGFISLPIDAESTGWAEFTVTLHNYIPFLGSLEIVQNETFLNIAETVIDDDNNGNSAGNNDGMINPGEQIELGISLQNYGNIEINDVIASISADYNFITLIDSVKFYGTIAASASVFSDEDFVLSIAPDVPGNTDFSVSVSIQDGNNQEWNDQISFHIEGADLQPTDYTIYDGNNGILDPGETAEMTINAENFGTVSASDITGILFSASSEITISDSVGYFGDITSSSTSANNTDTFQITAENDILPGTLIELFVRFYNDEGYNDTRSFSLQVGEAGVTDPLGPDSYGYSCYDDGDVGYGLCPVYDWQEIDPAYGGAGNIIPLNDSGDMGDAGDVDLPFILRFYGENYTSMTVCSNGWAAPGGSESRSFMNWSIPGPNGPSPLIAPFWDDLVITNGHVCYFYDAIQQIFVVEWSHLLNDYNHAEETFQIIIYDNAVYPTATGENQILFQYKTIHNVDQGNYGNYSNHGEYATVGLEDHTCTRGLQYTYSNQYPAAAKTLEDEMAILFTTPAIPAQGPFVGLISYEIDDSLGNNDGIVNPGETIEMILHLKNFGTETAEDVVATISSSDQFTTVDTAVQSFGSIMPDEIVACSDAYSFTLENICPDQHGIIFDLVINTITNSTWSSTFEVSVFCPDIATSTNELDFEEIYLGYSESMTLTILNTGSQPLNVNNISTSNPDFSTDISAFDLAANESREVIVSVLTNIVGTIDDTLFIFSNDPDEAMMEVALMGECVNLIPPDISINPTMFNQTVPIDQIVQDELTIENNGESDLLIHVSCPDELETVYAAELNGIDDYITVGNDSNLRPNFPFTASAWIKIYSSKYHKIFGNDAAGPLYYGFWFGLNDADEVTFSTGNGEGVSPSSRRTYASIPTVPLNEWYHITVVGHSFNNREIYFNGEPVACAVTGDASSMVFNGDDARIGQCCNGGYFDGLIDDIRFWDYALTQSEIQS
ncbi:MAG TPA: C25 family cysteine peptidase, partial [Candidatus Cloacimonadota bacterium]|nr:C25 family cysteine peptidase [Candidatus Cloacimonadota bacterium]